MTRKGDALVHIVMSCVPGDTVPIRDCRKYLTHEQNSVFEGNISDANLRKLKKELEKLIDPNADRINIYALQSLRYTYKERIGLCTRDGNIC